MKWVPTATTLPLDTLNTLKEGIADGAWHVLSYKNTELKPGEPSALAFDEKNYIIIFHLQAPDLKIANQTFSILHSMIAKIFAKTQLFMRNQIQYQLECQSRKFKAIIILACEADFYLAIRALAEKEVLPDELKNINKINVNDKYSAHIYFAIEAFKEKTSANNSHTAVEAVPNDFKTIAAVATTSTIASAIVSPTPIKAQQQQSVMCWQFSSAYEFSLEYGDDRTRDSKEILSTFEAILTASEAKIDSELEYAMLCYKNASNDINEPKFLQINNCSKEGTSIVLWAPKNWILEKRAQLETAYAQCLGKKIRPFECTEDYPVVAENEIGFPPGNDSFTVLLHKTEFFTALNTLVQKGFLPTDLKTIVDLPSFNKKFITSLVKDIGTLQVETNRSVNAIATHPNGFTMQLAKDAKTAATSASTSVSSTTSTTCKTPSGSPITPTRSLGD
ncbi:hypothetical protein AYO45_03875 [Gammaproteobacteria bacterium SCGC AG-212-F23]|nr:hypothetical protein AYO45_03875 [Gammaproteobacteria bacterium SCGC AG-212-F23]